MAKSAFPLPFTESILDAVVGHDMYSFLDGFNGYNQVCMYPDDQEKMTFVTDQGGYVAVVIVFGLKTTPTTFQRTIREIFEDYILAFMQIFLDDFAVYGTIAEHLSHLRLCLGSCRASRLSLNLAKCAFGVTSGALLDHIISKEGIAVDPNKISAIIRIKMWTTANDLNRFLRQILWHSCML